MTQKNLDSLLKISTDEKTGRLKANWDELPQGTWTNDITWQESPEDGELAALAVLAYRNLRERTSDDPEVCLKVWGIGDGLAKTMWYAKEPTKRKVDEIAGIAILIATQPVPEKK
jgi:hypothetical protein